MASLSGQDRVAEFGKRVPRFGTAPEKIVNVFSRNAAVSCQAGKVMHNLPGHA